MLLTLKGGRRRPKTRSKLRFRDYLAGAISPLPGTPVVIDYSALAAAALEEMYLNDTYGCCVEAGQAHSVGVFTGNATGVPFIFTDAQIEAIYGTEGGFVPGDPSTDNGTDEQTAFADWKANGLLPDGSHKIAGALQVDSTNPVELRAAIWLFENLCFGMELPDEWIDPLPQESGFAWDVAGDPDPENGHFVVGFGCNLTGIKFATWAMTGTLTYGAIAKYCVTSANGDCNVVVSQDVLVRAMNKAPNGLNWDQLMADFDKL
jgi:hypothetical protein